MRILAFINIYFKVKCQILESSQLYSEKRNILSTFIEIMRGLWLHICMYLDSQSCVVLIAVPPDILDYPTSTDMVVREGTNVTLRCAATGSPQPNITWRREGGEAIPMGNGQESR
jgi:hypothetical protein